jgi:putative ABC transport system permease protein
MVLAWVDAFRMAWERLWHHRVLVLWALLGLSSAATLALSLTLYADAVNTGLLGSRLGDPPYAYRFRYVGSWEGNIELPQVSAAHQDIQAAFVGPVGFPPQQQTHFYRALPWPVRLNNRAPIGNFSLGVLEGVEGQIEIVAGAWPPEAPPTPNRYPVILPESALYRMGVAVGDQLNAQRVGGPPIVLEVVALWRPLNPDDPRWIYPTTAFDTVMLTSPDIMAQALEGLPRPIEETAWFITLDGSQVKTADVGHLLTTSSDSRREVNRSLRGIRLDVSPDDELRAFQKDVQSLTQQLFIMVLPVAGLVLYFVGLIAGLLVNRQQDEDVILRSRGMGRLALLRVHALMWLILAGISVGVAVLLAPMVVDLVGRTSSFLRFDGTGAGLTVVLTPQALLTAVLTSLLAASSGLWAAWRSSAATITSLRQAQGRERGAWWQRAYLDFLLMLPALYVLYTLQQGGGIAAQADNPFADPLTFLAPTLFALSLTLSFLRLLPALLRFLGRMLSFSSSIPLLMALRELTRSTSRYRGALLMMCLTLSLTGFMASLASTLDQSLKDSTDYRIGADAVMVLVTDAQTETQNPTQAGQSQRQEVRGFNVLPASDLLQIEGVAQVSRVGRYEGRLNIPGQRLEGQVLAVDRAAIAAVARSRDDYAALPYGNIFNLLAGQRNGLIVNAQTAAEYNLAVGQVVEYQVFALNEWHESTAPIVGVLDFFPTLDPRAGFFMLTSIDPLFELVGTPLPHDFWLDLAPGAEAESVRQQARARGFPVLEWQDPEAELAAAKAAPVRRGVFGFLSVGFLASILLTLIVAIVQSAASFRAQSAQLGSLRAMGLSGPAVGMYVLFTQGIAAASGILGGTLIGLATTLLYLPLLDFSGGLPPYLIRVAWGEIIQVYAIFAAILLLVILGSSVLLGRQQVATIVKLGDAG